MTTTELDGCVITRNEKIARHIAANPGWEYVPPAIPRHDETKPLHWNAIDRDEADAPKVGEELTCERTGEALGVVKSVEEVRAGVVRVMAAVYSYHE